MTKISKYFLFLALAALGLFQPASAENAVCNFGEIRFMTDFPTARINGCEEKGKEYYLTIKPEKQPINPSPWYAFRVESRMSGKIAITLKYDFGEHRYWPKFSTDGHTWHTVKPGEIKISEDKKSARFRVKVKRGEPLWVAGQEIFTNRQHNLWMIGAAREHEFIDLYKLGKSTEGRDIFKLETRVPSPKAPTVILLGRQHPPEVTGALAMVPFMETLFADSELARRFREKYRIVAIPNLNPDGVARGNWRGNISGQDLNRDWGKFTQPETELVRRELLNYGEGKRQKGRLALMLDFHSTWENLMYTQNDKDKTDPENFAVNWHRAIRERAGDIPLRHAPGPSGLKKGTAKGYFYITYGVPSITYEMGDEADRDNIRELAVVAAEEMMKIMLSP
ncbi:M14 family metallopeptidase [Emcibacter sp.]|uniref:M14 family metallopeptidase n=1 Tax=Emcibacter sp. TaxID=1979954 RepID=UPI002AA70D16|nr:M14 family metallopeptidase [Emcibacter sp.]